MHDYDEFRVCFKVFGLVFTFNILYYTHFLHISHISFLVASYLLPMYFSVMLLNVSLIKFLSSFLARCVLGHGAGFSEKKRIMSRI